MIIWYAAFLASETCYEGPPCPQYLCHVCLLQAMSQIHAVPIPMTVSALLAHCLCDACPFHIFCLHPGTLFFMRCLTIICIISLFPMQGGYSKLQHIHFVTLEAMLEGELATA